MKWVEISVKGMTCEHCVKRVERAILSTGKARDVVIDLNSGKVSFYLEDDLDLDGLRRQIELYGYQVEL